MPQGFRNWITIPRLATLFTIFAVLLLFILTRLSAPLSFDLLAGPKDSTFYKDALRFQEILARDGVYLNIVETKGTVDNLRLLMEATSPTAAFADALGAAQQAEAEVLDNAGDIPDDEEVSRFDDVTSLGAIYLQPMWIFAQMDTRLEGLEGLSGRRLGVGPKGSTSRLLAQLMLPLLDGEQAIEMVDVGGADEKLEADEVLRALRNGTIVAAVAIGQPSNLIVDRLLRAEDIRLVSMRRAEAYALHFPFLTQVRLPEGGYDLAENIPPEDIETLAASTELVVTSLFPPPLADLLLQATGEIHGEASMFTKRDAFPNPDMVSIALNSSAARFYEQGPPLLRQFVPFWLATWIDRFIMVVVAFGSIAFGLFSLLPKLVDMHLQRQLDRAYKEMEVIEKALLAGGDTRALLAGLDDLDERTADIRILVRGGVSSWLEMRQFLHDLRERVQEVLPS